MTDANANPTSNPENSEAKHKPEAPATPSPEFLAEISQLNQSVPRTLPLLVRLQQYVGGVVPQLGWFFLAFGGAFAMVFLSLADLTGWIEFQSAKTTTGTVDAATSTNTKVNKRTVMAYSFHYVIDGTTYRGTSYSSDSLSAGQTVTIEYLPTDVSNSRIQNQTRSVFGPEVSFVAIFPLVGLVMAIYGLRSGKRATALLVNGLAAPARLISTENTNARVNNRPVKRLTFAFNSADGQAHTATAYTHETERLTNEAFEIVVYDPHAPQDAVMVDALPGHVRLGGNGQIESNTGMAVATLIAPALALAALIFVPLLMKAIAG